MVNNKSRKAAVHKRNLKKHGLMCGTCHQVFLPLNIRRHMATCAKKLVAARAKENNRGKGVDKLPLMPHTKTMAQTMTAKQAALEITTALELGHQCKATDLANHWVSKGGELWVTDRAYKVRATRLYNLGITYKGMHWVLRDDFRRSL
jgi:hypothetical protein